MSSKFLVIQTAFIGDVILATSVAEKLHRFFPKAQIDFLVRKGNESLFDGHPFIRKVLIWDKKKNKNRNLKRLLRVVKTEHYDVVVNCHRFASSGILTMMSGANERIGFLKNPFAFSFSVRKKHVITKKSGASFIHEIDRYNSLIEHLTDQSRQLPALYPTKKDFESVNSWLNQPFITISPASIWFTKQTPPDVWIRFIQNQDRQVYLLGGPGDVALCTQIQAACPNNKVEILSGKLSFLQSAALMKSAVMNYTNDSAPLHLCSAVQAPVAAVFCSTIPEFGFGPLSDRSIVVQSHETLPCKPCGLHGHKTCPQGHFKCSRIDINELLRAAP